MSKIPMVISVKCCYHCKIVFDHIRLSFNAINTVHMCKIGIKCQFVSRAICAYAHDVRKRPGCALIGACALIRTNTVNLILK